MNTCQTCKRWTISADDHISTPIDPDTWEPMEMPFRVGRCASPFLIEFERPITPIGASVCDGSEYMARLYTAENFGCLNWELK